MRLKLTNKQSNYKQIMNYFCVYLIIQIFINFALIYFHFEIDSIGNILFSVMSAVLPLISLTETYLYFDKCVEFLKNASRMYGGHGPRLLTMKIILKGLFIVFVICTHIVLMLVRCIFFNTLFCKR